MLSCLDDVLVPVVAVLTPTPLDLLGSEARIIQLSSIKRSNHPSMAVRAQSDWCANAARRGWTAGCLFFLWHYYVFFFVSKAPLQAASLWLAATVVVNKCASQPANQSPSAKRQTADKSRISHQCFTPFQTYCRACACARASECEPASVCMCGVCVVRDCICVSEDECVHVHECMRVKVCTMSLGTWVRAHVSACVCVCVRTRACARVCVCVSIQKQPWLPSWSCL